MWHGVETRFRSQNYKCCVFPQIMRFIVATLYIISKVDTTVVSI